MALSNWDTLAIDEKGEPMEGRLESSLGVRIEIYKNWLYVYDAKSWREGGPFVEDCIMSIEEGSLRYHDVTIKAHRGPKQGIYLAAWVDYPSEPAWKGMVGIGCYGYDDHGNWVGIDKHDVRHLQRLLLADRDVPEELQRLDLSKARRFNQGDRYLASKVGLAPPDSVPGEAEEPIFTRLLQGDDQEMRNPMAATTRLEAMAHAAHETNRAYCRAIGDMSQDSWDEAPLWQRQSARNGVSGVLLGNSPEDSHAAWLEEKYMTGWKYGPVKDPERKEHPCMVPYSELPEEQRRKDALFVAVVLAMRDALRDGDVDEGAKP